MEYEISQQDAMVVEKIEDLCVNWTSAFEGAIECRDLPRDVELFYLSIISRIEDLVDQIEHPEVKADLVIETVTLKVRLDEMVVNAKEAEGRLGGV